MAQKLAKKLSRMSIAELNTSTIQWIPLVDYAKERNISPQAARWLVNHDKIMAKWLIINRKPKMIMVAPKTREEH